MFAEPEIDNWVKLASEQEQIIRQPVFCVDRAWYLFVISQIVDQVSN